MVKVKKKELELFWVFLDREKRMEKHEIKDLRMGQKKLRINEVWFIFVKTITAIVHLLESSSMEAMSNERL
ncbi:hypothetical protein [Anaplasma marginale]|uniref:hypothetical protein n=1 Tax=Anaplasma marginale TaxID=770 RepID=UPI0002E2323B|nr:hypothetical protein [Anaplasma marginale]